MSKPKDKDNLNPVIPESPEASIHDEATEWPEANGEMPISFYLAQKDPQKYEGQDI